MASRADQLPTWARQIIDELHESDRRATNLAHGLTAAQLNWKPAAHMWSVGQCLDHLLVANNVYLPPIATALDNKPRSPVDRITPGWGGRWFIRNYIEPSPRSRTARAPRKITPSPQVETTLLDEFLRSQDIARDLVRRASDYNVNRIRFVNPFVPLVRFTVGTGFEIIWRHQRRHLLQADKVKQTPGFPER